MPLIIRVNRLLGTYLGASFLAHTHAQHDGERGHLPERQRQLLLGETTRKRLGIPMFLGEVH